MHKGKCKSAPLSPRININSYRITLKCQWSLCPVCPVSKNRVSVSLGFLYYAWQSDGCAHESFLWQSADRKSHRYPTEEDDFVIFHLYKLWGFAPPRRLPHCRHNSHNTCCSNRHSGREYSGMVGLGILLIAREIARQRWNTVFGFGIWRVQLLIGDQAAPLLTCRHILTYTVDIPVCTLRMVRPRLQHHHSCDCYSSPQFKKNHGSSSGEFLVSSLLSKKLWITKSPKSMCGLWATCLQY